MQSDSLVRLCRFVLTFNLALSAVPGQPASRVLAPADANRYEAFFKQVVKLKTISENSTTVKGRSYRIVVPRIQDVIGLADQEVEVITATAKQCVSELQSLLVAHEFVFEARLQELESGWGFGARGEPDSRTSRAQAGHDARPRSAIEK
jgi:hypothetical protein